MSTTIPCILRALGNKNPDGFTKAELLSEFIVEGYSPDRADRRTKECIASHQIIPAKENGKWLTLYSPTHWKYYPEELEDVRVIAVKIERDGSVTVL